jgi:hypothetical protein
MMPLGSSALESLVVPPVAAGAVVVLRCCLGIRISFWADVIEMVAMIAVTDNMKTLAERTQVLPVESPSEGNCHYTTFLVWRAAGPAAKHEILGLASGLTLTGAAEHRHTAAKLLTRDEARRIAVGVANLTED